MSDLLTEDQVLAALQKVKDPELGVSIVDLGLVYGIEITGASLQITMTMTSAGCPLADVLEAETEAVLRAAFPRLFAVVVELVWEPEWSPMMISWKAKEQLGWTH